VLTDLRVCFVGDSFVAGVGDPDHLGWVGRVAARTHRAGRPLTAYALGVRRQTSQDVADRWRVECCPRLPDGCDGRVVVAFGVNDTTIDAGATGPRLSAAGSAAHLARMLSEVRDAGWAALVVGPPPIAETDQNERIARLDTVFSATCGAAGVGYVGVFEDLLADRVWMQQVAADDGAHPGAEGYRRLADLVWVQWLPWVAAGIP
jgi:acyl-CoA thioesterase-1